MRDPGRAASDASAPRAASEIVPLLAVFGVVAFVVYAPSLGGPMFSDDTLFVSENPYIQDVSLQNLGAILDPGSPAPQLVAAYSPVALLLHAGTWQAFGPEVGGHHAVNVVLHALGSALLVLFLLRWGVSPWPARFAGLLFLVHPANVEAVAWISQLKTSASFVLGLLALLAHPRRPLLGVVLFALALLAKPTAASVLFVVAGLGVVRRAGPEPAAAHEDWRWPFVAAWGLVLLAYAPAYSSAFAGAIPDIAPLYEDPGVRLRSVAGVGLRYLVMAVSGYGSGAFHEPPGATSWLDPWWLASLPVLAAMLLRIAVVWRRRSVELVFWLWAASWYAVICGIVPLPFPLADRHLYFILPGLIGVACFALPEAARWLLERSRRAPSNAQLRYVAVGAAALLAVVFAAQSRREAGAYGQPGRLYEVAAERYPEGTVARTLKARAAAHRGDVDATLRELKEMRIHYKRVLFDVLADPLYATVREDPRFDAFLRELARAHLVRPDRPHSQLVLRQDAFAHMVLDDPQAAERVLREALEIDGPIREQLRADLDALARARASGQL